jgi:hypothetical protein
MLGKRLRTLREAGVGHQDELEGVKVFVLPTHPFDPLDRLGTRFRVARLEVDVYRHTVYLRLHADVDLTFANPWHCAHRHGLGGRPVLAEDLDKQRDQLLEIIGASGHLRNLPSGYPELVQNC